MTISDEEVGVTSFNGAGVNWQISVSDCGLMVSMDCGVLRYQVSNNLSPEHHTLREGRAERLHAELHTVILSSVVKGISDFIINNRS